MRLAVDIDGRANLLLVNQQDELLEDRDVQLEACEMAAVGHDREQFCHNEHVETRVKLGANHTLAAHLRDQILEAQQ